MGVGESPGSLAAAAWPGFLRGTSAEILCRMAESDPLRLRELAARRLREVWLLLDPDRAFRRALAVCAEAAPREPPPRDLAAWALAKVERALEQLVRADREAERADPRGPSEEAMDFPLLTECLLLEPELVRSASVAFNALEPLPRRAFFELLVEGRELAACIEKGPWDEEGLYEAVQTALAALGLDALADSPEDPGKGRKQ